MKIRAAALGVAIVAVVAVLCWPMLSGAGRAHPGAGAQAPSFGQSQVLPSTRPPSPEHSITAPTSAEEQQREELGTRRVPYFRYLKEHYPDRILKFGVTGDLDTLDLVVAKDDDEAIRELIQQAVAPSASEYGFRRIRFFTQNPAGSVERLNLTAESTVDDDRHWHTWRK